MGRLRTTAANAIGATPGRLARPRWLTTIKLPRGDDKLRPAAQPRARRAGRAATTASATATVELAIRDLKEGSGLSRGRQPGRGWTARLAAVRARAGPDRDCAPSLRACVHHRPGTHPVLCGVTDCRTDDRSMVIQQSERRGRAEAGGLTARLLRVTREGADGLVLEDQSIEGPGGDLALRRTTRAGPRRGRFWCTSTAGAG